ncbi:FecR family protein [Cribrihabitans marinus]|uniref:FecR family protein n=1 Tax=Cribrihabitans marinus TaxID=1227549 RepID=A0A1H7B3S2_9RHOB|nr:Ig-like domain-containing protein [Cribrihabitans marinus]GGH32502.1 hypothetical protein GCM10010973_24030 [Cribrihabitans marinus]SEJ68900.1 FecR family protein [Cribrihabitans marinus]
MSREAYYTNGFDRDVETLSADATGAIRIPGQGLLFGAEFQRLGGDLYIHNDGAPTLRAADYFRSEPADLVAPDGAALRGDLVARLAGPEAPAQYTQAGTAPVAGPIGQVETVSGEAWADHSDGSSVRLEVGVKILQNDVIRTAEGGGVSITFVDGTIFTLSSNSRMVIDELIYDPDSAANSGGFSLIQGSFVFIAGQVAKTGGMQVDTPSATMGIRGTTVLVQIQTIDGVLSSEVTLTRDPDGAVGEIVLRDLQGNVIANIADTDSKWVVFSGDGGAREEARTALDDAEDSILIADAVAAYQSAYGRVEAGQTFVTFGTQGPGTGGTTPVPQGPGGPDLNGIDEPEAIDPSDTGPETEGTDPNAPFDEGRLRIDPVEAGELQVTGLEDSGEGSIGGALPVSGTLSSAALLQGPANGVALVLADGSYSYTPNPDFFGTDSFTYTLTDTLGNTATGTVVVNVLPVNDPPELDDASTQVAEDGRVTGALAANDIDSATLVYTLETPAANGQVALLSDGTYAYTPGADFAGTDSFTVRVSDGEGGSDLAVVSIVVLPVGDAPTVTTPTGQAQGAVTEGAAPVSVSGQLQASDPDNGAVLAWSGSADGTYGRFEIAGDGGWTYTLDPTLAEALAEGETVQESFAATVTDDTGASAAQQVTVAVTGSNDAPVVTTPTGQAQGAVTEVAGPVSVSGQLQASDPDSGAVLAWSGSADGTYGRFEIAGDGGWTYTLDPTLADALAEGETVQESFAATVTDDTGASASQQVTVAVTGSNDAPTVTTPAGQAQGAVTEGAEQTTTGGRLTASDPDQSAAVVWSGSAAGAFGAFVIASDGTWTYQLDNTLADPLAEGQVATESFLATATDALGASTTQTVTVSITGTNDLPIVARETVIEVAPGGSVAGQLAASDVETPAALSFAPGANGPANGAVTIAPDGIYAYAPAAGFQGIDRFDYTVTDADGGVSTGRVTVEVVNTSGTGGNGQLVSLAINADPAGGAPAGSVTVTALPVAASEINLVFALDRSGSIGAQGWAEQTAAVADALDLLAAQFAGSATQVDVQIITYAGSVTTLPLADLQDPGLSAAVRALPFTGGSTNWTDALREAEAFLDGQPETEANFLFFSTDGEPTSGGWEAVLADLTDVGTKGYSVSIEAFGIGPDVDLVTLSQLDPTPTLLSSPTQLADALTETPIFNPELVAFEVTLEVDGVDQGVIADLDSPALVQNGLSYDLAFAEIAGLADLLGTSNRFSVRVGFDLDGDAATAEIELFDTEVFAPLPGAQSVAGAAGSEFLAGSALADTIGGAGGNDLILGFGGDDLLNGGSGVDSVLAGAGDDRLVVSGLNEGAGDLLDGGAGRDVLQVDAAGDIGADLLPTLTLRGIEAIDMENGQANALDLSLSDLLDLSDTPDNALEGLLARALPESATIYGDTGDVLTLDGGAGSQVQATGETVNDGAGHTLAIYNFVAGGSVLATLAVDADISVNAAPAA